MTTSDYLTQLQQDKADLVDNLETMGITGLTGDETFTELVPEVLNISGGGGADLDDYFKNIRIVQGSENKPSAQKMIKKFPSPIYLRNKNIQFYFYGFEQLTETPEIINDNSTKYTNTSYLFYDCSQLKKAILFDTSGVTNMSSMFGNCSKLETVPTYSFKSATNLSGIYYFCIALTDESLNNILASCISATSYTGTKTLAQLGFASNYYDATRFQSLSNYQDFLNAGWTIGY